MQNWKKIVALGTIGAGAALAFSGRRSLGIASAAGGLALLASEYPDTFEEIWDKTPEYVHRASDYVHRASEIFATLSRLAEKFAEETRRRGVLSFDEAV